MPAQPAGPSPCAICQNSEFSWALTSHPWGHPEIDREYQRCLECGVIREDPIHYRDLTFDPNSAAATGDLTEEDRRAFQFLYGELIDVVGPDGAAYARHSYSDRSSIAAALVARIEAHLPAGEGLRVLDVGCADGFVLRALAERRPDIVGIGVDPSPVAHRQAAAADTTTLLGALADVDLAPHAPFDAVWALGNLGLHPDPAASLASLAEVLAPGGMAIVDMKNMRSLPRLVALALGRTPMRRQRQVRAYLGRSYSNVRWMVDKSHCIRLINNAGLDVHQITTLSPRLLDFDNRDRLGRGIAGVFWRVADAIDGWRDERAWIQVVAIKPPASESATP